MTSSATATYRCASNSTSPVRSLELGQRFRVLADDQGHPRPPAERISRLRRAPAGRHAAGRWIAARELQARRRSTAARCASTSRRARSATSATSWSPTPQATYRVLPGILRDTFNRGRMRVGKEGALEILAPGQKSQDPYEMNGAEHFELARKLFDDGRFDEAQAHLDALFADTNDRRRYERDIARMLLWIHTGREKLDAAPHRRDVRDPARAPPGARHPVRQDPHRRPRLPRDRRVRARLARLPGRHRLQLPQRRQAQRRPRRPGPVPRLGALPGGALVRIPGQRRRQSPPTSPSANRSSRRPPRPRAIAAREKRLRERQPDAAEPDAEAAEKPGDRDEPEKVAMLEHSRRLLHRFLTLYPERSAGRRRRLLRGQRLLRPQGLREGRRARRPRRRAPPEERAQDQLRIHGRARALLAAPLRRGPRQRRPRRRRRQQGPRLRPLHHRPDLPRHRQARRGHDLVRQGRGALPRRRGGDRLLRGEEDQHATRSPPSSPARRSSSRSTTATSARPPSRSTRSI